MHNLTGMSSSAILPSIRTGWDASSSTRREPNDLASSWRIVAITDGVYRCHQKSCSLTAGHILLMVPGQCSDWKPTAGSREICLHFDLAMPSGCLWDIPVQEVVSPAISQGLLPRLITIASIWWLSPRHLARSNALLGLVLLDLVDAWAPETVYDAPAPRRETNDLTVIRAEGLARQRLNSWRVADMAAAVGMSCTAFTRLYRRERGLTPGAFLDAARVSLGKSMLTGTDEPLAMIAASCGHPLPQSFGRWFKSRVGQTPGEYRRRSRGVGVS
jgi:AraC-like DNA-binding protein